MCIRDSRYTLERERERQRQRQTDRDRNRDRQTDRQTDRQRIYNQTHRVMTEFPVHYTPQTVRFQTNAVTSSSRPSGMKTTGLWPGRAAEDGQDRRVLRIGEESERERERATCRPRPDRRDGQYLLTPSALAVAGVFTQSIHPVHIFAQKATASCRQRHRRRQQRL